MDGVVAEQRGANCDCTCDNYLISEHSLSPQRSLFQACYVQHTSSTNHSRTTPSRENGRPNQRGAYPPCAPRPAQLTPCPPAPENEPAARRVGRRRAPRGGRGGEGEEARADAPREGQRHHVAAAQARARGRHEREARRAARAVQELEPRGRVEPHDVREPHAQGAAPRGGARRRGEEREGDRREVRALCHAAPLSPRQARCAIADVSPALLRVSVHPRLRQVDVKAEHFERQVQRAEQERDAWEQKYEVRGPRVIDVLIPFSLLTLAGSGSQVQEVAAGARGAREEHVRSVIRQCIRRPPGHSPFFHTSYIRISPSLIYSIPIVALVYSRIYLL